MIRIFTILLITLPTCLMAQVEDAELWTGIGIKSDLGKKFGLKYETQTRFHKNISVLRQYYNELSLDYEVVKNVELGITYRHSFKIDEAISNQENRFCFNLEYGDKIKPLDLRIKGRARYQFAYDRFSVINDMILPDQKSTFRFKVDLEYSNKKIKRFIPSIGYELFKSFAPVEIVGIDAYRIYAGIDFDLPARHEIGLRYTFEKDISDVVAHYHIYLIQYNYKLDWKFLEGKE